MCIYTNELERADTDKHNSTKQQQTIKQANNNKINVIINTELH